MRGGITVGTVLKDALQLIRLSKPIIPSWNKTITMAAGAAPGLGVEMVINPLYPSLQKLAGFFVGNMIGLEAWRKEVQEQTAEQQT